MKMFDVLFYEREEMRIKQPVRRLRNKKAERKQAFFRL
jgi:hypothetical protein